MMSDGKLSSRPPQIGDADAMEAFRDGIRAMPDDPTPTV